MLLTNIFSFYGAFSAKIACIWLAFWAIRKSGDVDYPLDNFARGIRWLIVVIGFTLGYYIPGPNLAYLRVIAGSVGLALLCWPNLAYHLANLCRRSKTGQDLI